MKVFIKDEDKGVVYIDEELSLSDWSLLIFMAVPEV